MVSAYLSPRCGGPAINAQKIGSKLKEFGYEVSWWSTNVGKELIDKNFINDNKVNLFDIKFPKKWYRCPELKKKLSEEIENIHLLHMFQLWDYPIYAAASIAKKNKKPYIISTGGIFTQEWRYRSIKKALYLKIIAINVLKQAACIHIDNEKELDGLRRLGIYNPVVIIPNGVNYIEVDKGKYRKLAEDIWPSLYNKTVVLFLGRLSKEKGLDNLILAWEKVVQKEPNAILLIAGPDFKGYLHKLKELVKEKMLKDKIVFTGFVGGEKKIAALVRADIYVQPSYSEGFSTSILEALSFGKPCIITKMCNFPEVERLGVGDCVEPDHNSISNSIIKHLNLSSMEKKFIENKAKALIKDKYLLDKIIYKYKVIYEKIMNKEEIPLRP